MNVSQLFWDRIAKNFDGQEEGIAQARSKTVERTKKYLRSSDAFLDYGCGTGALAVELAGSAKVVQGIDISSKMIAMAKRKAAERNIENIDFRQSALFDQRLEKESFDVVLASGILHLIKDPQKAVQRIYELLKPGGWFVSSTPCMGENETVATAINRIVFLPGKIGIFPQFRFFKIDDLERSIAKGGFEIVERESLTFGTQHDGRYVIARLVVGRKG